MGWRLGRRRRTARDGALLALVCLIMVPVVGTEMPGNAGEHDAGRSPALCGPGDTQEPGIQGDVPAGATANYDCGLRLLGEIPRAGAMQAAAHCAYVRSGGVIWVIDVTDPTRPTEIGSVPTSGASETMRAVVNGERAVLVSGRAVYDISDCEKPVLKGEIPWPRVEVIGVPQNLLPHDIRINHAGTKVYASFGVWEADITDLGDSGSWTVTNQTCKVLSQFHPLHKQTFAAGISLCDSSFNAATGTLTLGANPTQSSLMWPQLSHSPDTNAAGTRLYVGDQSGGLGALWDPEPRLRVIDLTQNPPRLVSEAPGSGHSLDWFRTAGGREFVLHANEFGSGDTCQRHNRPESLGWAFDAPITEVTRDRAKRVSKLELAINKPQFCEAKRASGRDTAVSYHSIDNPADAKFAAVSFGSAGLRVFDIRNPRRPVEVAYFNHGPLTHAGISHYDAVRGLIYIPGARGLEVLELQPQVRRHLGLDR